MKHHLKIKQCYLKHIVENKKSFEVRFNDRDFQVGDTIVFLPLNDDIYNVYENGQISNYQIIYVHHALGMAENYVVLGIEPSRPRPQ